MAALIEAATPINSCQCCRQPREIGVMPDSPSVVFATCRTPGCDLENVTLPLDDVLTERQMAGYARVNRQLRQSRERFAEREAGWLMGAES